MLVISSALVSMTTHSTNSEKSKCYTLMFNGRSHLANSDIADSVYNAFKRHIVRVVKRTNTMRESVYTLRSDIRALVREIHALEYAH
jgi:hypothetical protein